MGGEDGSRWITPYGMEILERYRASCYPISITARELATYAVRRGPHDSITLAEIIKDLGWERDQAQQAMEELHDYELAEARSPHRDVGYTVLQLTTKGRRAVHSGFRREDTPASVTSVGAIFHGPVTSSNVQSAANIVNSTVKLAVDATGDRDRLLDQVDQTLRTMVEAVTDLLDEEGLQEYRRVADEFFEEIKEETPDRLHLRRLLNTLSFLSDTEGTLQLAARVAPYLPLVYEQLRHLGVA